MNNNFRFRGINLVFRGQIILLIGSIIGFCIQLMSLSVYSLLFSTIVSVLGFIVIIFGLNIISNEDRHFKYARTNAIICIFVHISNTVVSIIFNFFELQALSSNQFDNYISISSIASIISLAFFAAETVMMIFLVTEVLSGCYDIFISNNDLIYANKIKTNRIVYTASYSVLTSSSIVMNITMLSSIIRSVNSSFTTDELVYSMLTNPIINICSIITLASSAVFIVAYIRMLVHIKVTANKFK